MKKYRIVGNHNKLMKWCFTYTQPVKYPSFCCLTHSETNVLCSVQPSAVLFVTFPTALAFDLRSQYFVAQTFRFGQTLYRSNHYYCKTTWRIFGPTTLWGNAYINPTETMCVYIYIFIYGQQNINILKAPKKHDINLDQFYQIIHLVSPCPLHIQSYIYYTGTICIYSLPNIHQLHLSRC